MKQNDFYPSTTFSERVPIPSRPSNSTPEGHEGHPEYYGAELAKEEKCNQILVAGTTASTLPQLSPVPPHHLFATSHNACEKGETNKSYPGDDDLEFCTVRPRRPLHSCIITELSG